MTVAATQSSRQPPETADLIVAIASSSGGIEALKTVLSPMPANLPAAIIIVQHLSSLFKSHLPEILSRHTCLQVKQADEGLKLLKGSVFVAPPNYHLIVNRDNTLSLSNAPKKHFVRPSAEYTFKSLANSYRRKAIAVVLTGYDGDGKEGVREIKELGGRIIAQDENTSAVFGMPKSAIQTGCVDLILPLNQIADGIVNMVMG